MGVKSIIAHPYIWISPAEKSDDDQYYKFILVYVYNLLEISQDSVSVIWEVAEKFKLKKY